MHTIQVLNNLVESNQALAYCILFLGLIFEGEIILISAGVLAHLGAFDFVTALIFIFAGGMVKTLIGYRIGEFLHKKFNHARLFNFLERKVLSVIPRFRERPFWSIFLSKFIMGMNYFVIIFSGYEKINFKKYLKAEIIATIIWAPLLLSLGYFFSYAALSVSKEISKFLLAIMFFLLVFILIEKIIELLYGLYEHFQHNKKNGEQK
ncbi:MAG: DedA family protein [Candidatus Pacebacteria bacterium]|nr:DedA family protein [Candidatus Paceibacterota bacterium]MBP9839703.1 DedA family protein [Candidatus Paceibacterota bacterium]